MPSIDPSLLLDQITAAKGRQSQSLYQVADPTAREGNNENDPVVDVIPNASAARSRPKNEGKGRSTNYTDSEDLQLCESWLEISEGAYSGVDQTSTTFWGRVAEHFNGAKQISDRSAGSLKSRWSTLHHAVNKFNACHKQVMRSLNGGKSTQDHLAAALALYTKLYKKGFNHIRAYNLLIKAPKWSTYVLSLEEKSYVPVAKRAREESESSTSQTPTTLTTEFTCPSSDASDMESVGPCPRPHQKKSKVVNTPEDLFKRWSYSTTQIAQAHQGSSVRNKTHLKVFRQYAEALEKLANDAIMSRDISQLDELSQEFYVAQKQEILAGVKLKQAKRQAKSLPEATPSGLLDEPGCFDRQESTGALKT